MNNQNLINPYSLLGITPNSSIKDLKKNYYNMALMCHPDKGGSTDDMHIVVLAYNYCRDQLESKEARQTTYEQLEKEFSDFCKEQESKPPPSFSSIYEETSDWINDFNNQFDKMNVDNNSLELETTDPFAVGYGELMDMTEDNTDLTMNNESDNLEYLPIEVNKPSNEFSKEIIEYKEPQYLPDSINYYPLNTKSISDFSGSTNNNSLIMTDYYKSYGKHKKLNEDDFEFKDYPSSYP